MQLFDDAYISKLNAEDGAGRLIKAVILTETVQPLVKKYLVDNPESIVFQGNTYEPLHMEWRSVKISQASPTETMTIGISNIASPDGLSVSKYLKEHDITGNTVVVQLLHIDLLDTLTNYWNMTTKVLASRYDSVSAEFDLGRRLGRNRLPRGVILKDKYPGVSSDVARIF